MNIQFVQSRCWKSREHQRRAKFANYRRTKKSVDHSMEFSRNSLGKRKVSVSLARSIVLKSISGRRIDNIGKKGICIAFQKDSNTFGAVWNAIG